LGEQFSAIALGDCGDMGLHSRMACGYLLRDRRRAVMQVPGRLPLYAGPAAMRLGADMVPPGSPAGD
jgi:hypothetical protein